MNKVLPLFFLTCCCALSFRVSAQECSISAGLRGGYGGLLTGKYYYAEDKSAEAIVSLRWKGVVFTGLLEWYKPAFGTDRLNWFYGGGFHLGLHSRDTELAREPDFDPKTYVNPGLDGIIGLEYRIRNSPLSFSLDWKPAIMFVGSRGFIAEDVGVSLRYCLHTGLK